MIGTIDPGSIAIQAAVWLVTTGATWLISARVTTAVHSRVLGDLSHQVEEIGRGLARARDGVQAEALARSACALSAARTYASHGEVLQVMNESSQRLQEFGAELSSVHGRITEVAKGLARLTGAIEAQGLAPKGGAMT